MIIWLIGPPLAGKSLLGSALAEKHGYRFVDTDEVIEREQGKKIAQIFSREGEGAFRELETALIERIANEAGEDEEAVIVATGGGAVLSPVNRDVMRCSGVRVFLRINNESASVRLYATSVKRPLLRDGRSWERLYAERLPFYTDSEAVVDTDDPQDLSLRRLERTLRGIASSARWEVIADTSATSSRIVSYPNIHTLCRIFEDNERNAPQRCVVTDTTVASLFPSTLKRIAGQQGIVIEVGTGEEHKTLAEVERIAERCMQSGMTRNGVIVGFGGGLVTDLAGFAASVYMRGVRAVYIPTTLLAMVDASVGGKTAVNASGSRNLLGTFRLPSDIYCCHSFLHTLPLRELKGGTVEALKMGIANSIALRKEVERATAQVWEGMIPGNIHDIIRLSIETKNAVVAEDTFDTGARRSLNLGHTFAHALESAEPGRYSHGEAVAFGLIASAELAYHLGKISPGRLRWICRHALRLLRRIVAEHDYRNILAAMRSDKKRELDSIRLVLPLEEIGVEILDVANTDLIIAAMHKAFERMRMLA